MIGKQQLPMIENIPTLLVSFVSNGCRHVFVDWNRVGKILWHGFNLFMLQFPVRIFLGHWEFPQLVA